jgi:hypothetical protein
MIFVGQAALRRAVTEFIAHYHRERNHQGLRKSTYSARAEVFGNGCVSLSA